MGVLCTCMQLCWGCPISDLPILDFLINKILKINQSWSSSTACVRKALSKTLVLRPSTHSHWTNKCQDGQEALGWLKTSCTVFPYTDWPRLANNIFMLFFPHLVFKELCSPWKSVLQNSSHKSAFWPRERTQNLGQSSILLFEQKYQVKNFCSGVFPFSWPSITPCQFSTTSKAIWLIYRQQILGTTFKKFFLPI